MARPDGLGLSAESRQLLGLSFVKAFLLTEPTHGAVVAGAGYWTMPQPVVCHGQEEEVECVRLALPGVQAVSQGCDRLRSSEGSGSRPTVRERCRERPLPARPSAGPALSAPA